MPRIGKHTAVTLDDVGGTPRILTGQITSIGPPGVTYDEVEAGGYSHDKWYLAARGDAPISLEGKFNDTALTGSHTVLNGLNGTNTAATLTVQFGGNAVPATGVPEFEGEYIVTSYMVTSDLNGLMTFSATLAVATSTLPTWGTMA